MEPDVAGEVGDRLLAALGRSGQAVEPRRAVRLDDVEQQAAVFEPTTQDGHHQVADLGQAGDRPEQARQRRLQLGRRFEVVDAVAGEGATQPFSIVVGQ